MNADQLRQAMAALPEPVTTLKPPHWEYWRWELWETIQEYDPYTFMSWPCVRHTMLVNHWSMQFEWDYLVNTDTARWPRAILPHNTGYPTDYFGGTPYSNNMINQAYHVALWENTTGKRIDQLESIIEFGGGYGAMALLCWRLGFRGKYIIYDLPEFSLLQEWFLSQEGVENVTWNPQLEPFVSQLDSDEITWNLQPKLRTTTDLLIALYSLSEMPPIDRDGFLSRVVADSYLFLYSPTWEEYDNVAYFRDFTEGEEGKHWHSQPTPRQTDHYLIGW